MHICTKEYAMKRETVWKVVISCSFAFILTASAYGQNRSATAPLPSNTSPQTNSASFLAQAIEINQAEVALGHLAESKAANQSVKDFSNMMIKDHSADLEKLQKLPGGNIEVKISKKHEDLKAKLSKLSGAQFDREYIDAMVSGHREAVGLFEQHSGASPNSPKSSASKTDAVSQLEAAAREMLPTIKHHLMEAESIQKALAKPAY
jgi:putative membrane protein